MGGFTKSFIQDKAVLVTGGTGSFGQKFAEIALREFNPKRLIVFSRDEFKQAEMQSKFADERLRFFLGDVRDRDRLYRAFRGVDVIIHAAALKQVPAAEYNPFEFVKTNIVGAQNVIDAAIDRGVERVMALSTDKAANPVNLYGATKLVSDKLFVAGNSYVSEGRPTIFSCVRYGNVLGSRGSVLPLFLRLRKSGVLPITHPEMTRFWLTLEQGVRFVVGCLDKMHGGEIFVPKIPSMRITDFALAIAPRCRQEVVGTRPGEKLHEVLIPEDEARHVVELEDMFVIKPDFPWWDSQNWNQGQPLAEGFRYSSDENSDWLPVETVRALAELEETDETALAEMLAT